jgi:hypothetical protein
MSVNRLQNQAVGVSEDPPRCPRTLINELHELGEPIDAIQVHLWGDSKE